MRSLWRDPIGRHVVIAVAVKLGLLTALWWGFVKDARVDPGVGEVRAAVLRVAPSAAAQHGETGK